MFKRIVISAMVLGVLAVPAVSLAQAWRGQGRVHGKVTDEAGKPIEGVTVKMFLPGANGGTDQKTDKKGEWSAGGIAGGAWQVDFIRQGYETRRITVPVQELDRIPMIETVLVKAVDPNAIIAEQLKKASALVAEKKFADAQAIYADLQGRYPQAYQLEIQIARAYDAEGAYDKEIEHLKKYIEKEPDNVGVKLLAGGVMIAKGNAEEGKQLLSSVDDQKVTEPAIFLNVGITLLNQNKPKDAMLFFEKTVARFPTYPDGYYYRGITNLQIGTALRPDNQAEGDRVLGTAKADLSKFVDMAPTAPEAAAAKKMLEQLK